MNKLKFDLNLINLRGFAAESEDLARALAQLEARLMSAFGEKLDALEAAWAGALARIQEDVAELQRLVDAGSATPEQLARLDALTAELGKFDPVPGFPPPDPGTAPA